METQIPNLTQLQLWPDEEMPEPELPLPNEEQEVEEDVLPEGGQLLATQLYLPGFEPQ